MLFDDDDTCKMFRELSIIEQTLLHWQVHESIVNRLTIKTVDPTRRYI